ncbi:MAG: Mu transposase domain-containing protein, partial [Gemmatimonas sp.]|uniref:Mu transposase domain-containing protein n=1 Tax=Gemmatimonas sp. TaxID=1962908 RepID=UPI0039195223
GTRYSVPAHLVGTTVTVREHASDFTVWAGETLVATHARQPRHQVVMASVDTQIRPPVDT